MDIDNKNKGMGKYLIDKAKELRDAGVPITMKGRLELFTLEMGNKTGRRLRPL